MKTPSEPTAPEPLETRMSDLRQHKQLAGRAMELLSQVHAAKFAPTSNMRTVFKPKLADMRDLLPSVGHGPVNVAVIGAQGTVRFKVLGRSNRRPTPVTHDIYGVRTRPRQVDVCERGC